MLGNAVLILFPVLLVVGCYMQELVWRHVALLLLVASGVFSLICLSGWPASLYIAFIALLDIILVLVIFKGDIKI